jgi:large subunit ribosomal protein L18
MSKSSERLVSNRKRARRVRFKVRLAGERPRLTVFRSNRHIYAQIIDDRQGVTLVQASTLDQGFQRKPGDPFNRETASEVGKRLAAKAKDLNITRVVFDRGSYLYHGKVRALADGARDGGLDF